MYHIFIIHSAFLWCLAIMNRATMDKDKKSIFVVRFRVFWCMSKCDIAGSWSWSILSLPRNLCTDFPSDCISLYSNQLLIKCSPSHNPLQRVLSFILLILAVLTGVRWNLKVVLVSFPWWLNALNIF